MKKRLAFDLHGVLRPYDGQLEAKKDMFTHGIEGRRRFFVANMQESLKLIRTQNVEIWVVSGPSAIEVRAELKDLGYIEGEHFDKVASVVDFLKEEKVEMWKDDKGTWWASEEDWWSAKARICKLHNIMLLTDDKEKYAPFFEGSGCKFVLWDVHEK